MKKFTLLLVLGVLCLSLAACAGEKSAAAATEPATDPTEATAFDWSAVRNASSGSSCAMEEYHTE